MTSVHVLSLSTLSLTLSYLNGTFLKFFGCFEYIVANSASLADLMDPDINRAGKVFREMRTVLIWLTEGGLLEELFLLF